MSEFTQAFFEEASKAWKANKTRVGEGSYRYKKNGSAKDPEEPVAPKPSVVNRKELKMRQQTEEEAPLPVRRSPRLKEEHKKIVYCMAA